jgi:hypothetical protein
MRVLFVLALASSLFALTGCHRRARVVETETRVPVSSGGGGVQITESPTTRVDATVQVTDPGGQLLYIPDASLLLDQVARIDVQTSDGRAFTLTRADLVQASFGRMALRVPAGVTTGTLTVWFLNGRQYSTTFHIAVSDGGQMVGTAGAIQDPRCHAIDGTWYGNISSDPSARATMQVQVLEDCRTITGFIHFESGGGSVDSTIDGQYDVYSGTLVGRDIQLFNVSPGPGGSFCATDQYRLQLQRDGATFTGENITSSYGCEGDSPVFLQRVR